jgi:hypothetical protein
MRKQSLVLAISCVIITMTLLPSCIKTYKLVPSESTQGKEHPDKRKVIKDNMRSVRVYDQWQTDAMFDVLWMSEQTQHAHAELYHVRRGTPMKVTKKEGVEFYILADVRDQFHPELDDDDASWTMYLEVDGTKITPSKIEKAQLDPEILSLFGHRFPRQKFKKPYRVTFPAGEMKYTLAEKKPFTMVISSVLRQCTLGWNGAHPVCVKAESCAKNKRKLAKDEDYYWL